MTLVAATISPHKVNTGRLKYIAGDPLTVLTGIQIVHNRWVLANGAVLPASGATAALCAMLANRFGSAGQLPVIMDGVVPIPKGASAFPTVGVAGGEFSHVLSLAEYPSHTHPTYDNSGPNRGNALDGYLNVDGYDPYTQVAFNLGGAFTKYSTVAGGGAAHNNMPLFQVGGYVLVRL